MENVSEGAGAPAAEEMPAAASEEAQHEPAARKSWTAVLSGRSWLLLSGALIIGVTFWYLQFSTASICCGDYDAYYHFRWSRMLWDGIWAGSFPPAFDALPLTTLNPKDYVDHHFLFHLFQAPFTFFSDFQTGAKIGTWLFACLAVYACYWLMVRSRLSYPLVWLFAILGSSAPFLYRIHMGKAMSVSIVLLIIGIYLLFERKYLWLLPLAFVFALTYDMVYLLLAASGFWFLATLWGERSLNRSVAWALGGVALVIFGTALGYVINPYFPHNIQLAYEHIMMKVTANDFSTAVGSEWYPYNTWEFMGNCATAVVAMVAGYLAYRGAGRRESQRALFLLLFATFLMLVNARWRRFSEYWPPFAVLFAAFALHPHIERARTRFLGRAADDAGAVAGSAPDAPETPRTVESIERARVMEFVLVGTALILLAAPLIWYARVTARDIAGMGGPELYRGGMEWLGKNTSKGDLIFNTDWDDFPKLFFYNPDLAYVSGLDPTYLLDKDKRLSDLYAKVSISSELSEQEVGEMGALIRDNFCIDEGEARRCARYAFTDHEHKDFVNNALDSGWFDLSYEDGDCSILRVRETRGDPWPDNVPPGGRSTGEGDADEDQMQDEPDDNAVQNEARP
ncbi:MAG: DUF308 domain-containing protein [Acidobacteria bacterium]|nr:DUF308 domain-containing protein [Acidobacteriota bacterium]